MTGRHLNLRIRPLVSLIIFALLFGGFMAKDAASALIHIKHNVEINSGQ